MAMTTRTFILCPDYRLRESDVRLGDIFAATKSKPRLIDVFSKLSADSCIDDAKPHVRTDTDFYFYDGNAHAGEASNGSNAAFAQGDPVTAVARQTQQRLVYITAPKVETTWFEPNRDYIARRLPHTPVRKEYFGWYTPPVFLITGIKLAHHAVSLNVELNSSPAESASSADKAHTQTKVPEDVWQDIAERAGENPATLYLEHDLPFVLAIEARQIQVEKRGFSDRVFDDYASLANDHSAHASDRPKSDDDDLLDGTC